MISFITEFATEIVVLLFTVIWLTVAIQPNTERTIVASVYGATLFAHLLFSSTMLTDGGVFLILSHKSIFFWTAGACDLFVIVFIARRIEITQLSSDLQLITAISLACNAVGWFLYMKAITAPLYHLIFILIYGGAVWALMKTEPTHAGHNRTDSRIIAFRFNAMARNFFHLSH